jgi:hypothetical protein
MGRIDARSSPLKGPFGAKTIANVASMYNPEKPELTNSNRAGTNNEFAPALGAELPAGLA